MIELIVILSTLVLLFSEAFFLDTGKLNLQVEKTYLIILLLLPLWNQNLVSVFPFLLLIPSFFIRGFHYRGNNIVFLIATCFNIGILYLQLGFLIKGFLIYNFVN